MYPVVRFDYNPEVIRNERIVEGLLSTILGSGVVAIGSMKLKDCTEKGLYCAFRHQDGEGNELGLVTINVSEVLSTSTIAEHFLSLVAIAKSLNQVTSEESFRLMPTDPRQFDQAYDYELSAVRGGELGTVSMSYAPSGAAGGIRAGSNQKFPHRALRLGIVLRLHLREGAEGVEAVWRGNTLYAALKDRPEAHLFEFTLGEGMLRLRQMGQRDERFLSSPESEALWARLWERVDMENSQLVVSRAESEEGLTTLPLSVSLGEIQLTYEQIADLRPGTVIEFVQPPEFRGGLYLGGQLLAEATVSIADSSVCVKLTKLG